MSDKPTIRILLSEAASLALTESGERAFTIIGRASHPEQPNRWVIHLAPVEWKAACDASSVLLGSHKAVRIKPAPTATPAATAGSPTNTP
jgi:hypothetical protein